MCGIVAVVRRRTDRATPSQAAVLAELNAAYEAMPQPGADELAQNLLATAEHLKAANNLLLGEAGVRCLLENEAVSYTHLTLPTICSV